MRVFGGKQHASAFLSEISTLGRCVHANVHHKTYTLPALERTPALAPFELGTGGDAHISAERVATFCDPGLMACDLVRLKFAALCEAL